MHKLILAVPLLTSCAASLPYTARNARVLSAPSVEVAWVDVDTPEGSRALIRVQGVDPELDGKVLLYTPATSNTRDYYSTTIDGGEVSLIMTERLSGVSHTILSRNRAGNIRLNEDREAARALQPQELIAEHFRQSREGILAEVQRFHRERRLAALNDHVKSVLDQFRGACGLELPVSTGYDKLTDAQLLGGDFSSSCPDLLGAMTRLCAEPAARAAFTADVRGIDCSTRPALSLDLTDGRLLWGSPPVPADAPEFARQSLLTQIPWSGEPKLPVRIERAHTVVCTDGKGRHVASRPSDKGLTEVMYGEGSTWSRVPLFDGPVRAGSFFDPREYDASGRVTPDGLDLHFVSWFGIDESSSKCQLRCGTRRVDLTVLDETAKSGLLDAAKWVSPAKRRPYALARDRRGVYYYVDTGEEPESKRFRLYVGPKGALKESTMTNIVSDSAGEIFSTNDGSLKLVLEKAESFWIKKGKSEALINLPVRENLGVIYRDLGLYVGQRYGTPCDIL